MSGPLNADAIRAGAAGAGAGAGYQIVNSLRLDGTGDMSRTVSSDGNLRTWTFAFWLKRSTFGTNGGLGFNVGGTYVNASNRSIFRFHSTLSGGDDDWYWAEYNGATWREDQATSSMHVDPSAWAHYMCVWDTDGGTTPRARRYINGVLVSDLKSGGTVAAANVDSGTNQAGTFQLFDQAGFPNREFEGYAADMYFLDGVAATPSDLGEFNSDTGQFVPIAYSGSFGSNGFYLDFADSSDLGKDVSGNNNHFTSSGLTAADQMLDTPTDNFCTLNPLITPATMTFADGNLALSGYTAVTSAYGTFGMSSGKWYWELVAQTNAMAGVAATPNGSQYPGQAADSYSFDLTNGTKYNNGSSSAFGAGAVSAGDTVGVAFDADNGDLKFYDNSGTLIGTAYSGLTSGPYFPVFRNGSAANISINFGQQTFSHSLPTSHVALNTANLPDPTIADGSEYFHPQLYTGTGTGGLAITNDASAGDFKPDILWLAPRSNGDNHVFFDSVRGTTQRIKSNSADPEDTDSPAQITFETDGFDLDGTDPNFNGSGRTYVAWQWHTTGGTSGSNTDGSITSTVSANATAGVSIVTYTGTGANATVGHGLGVAPQMILIKDRSNTESWIVYHEDVGNDGNVYLNLTNAKATQAVFNNTSPTSSVFSLGSTDGANKSSANHVAYCFAEVEGFSKFGSYEGNGSTDGPFIYTGFKPRFVMIKRYDATESWPILDTARGSGTFGSAAGSGGTNPTAGNDLNAVLVASTSAAEEDNPSGSRRASYVSNGFKVRTTNTAMNASGGDYLYMAFAESPFKTATAR